MAWQNRFKLGVLGIGLMLGGSGCLSCFHPIPPAPPEVRSMCGDLPQQARSGVYVFLFNGLDPLDYANLVGLRDELNRLGFIKTYYGQTFHLHWFKEELRKVHSQQPQAKFVILGFDYGAESATNLAAFAGEEGIPVESLIYLQPRGLLSAKRHGVLSVGKILAIQSENLINQEIPFDKAEVIRVPHMSRFGVPSHPITLEVLAGELTRASQGVPVHSASYEAFPQMPESPHYLPRPKPVEKSDPVDDWDFLKLNVREGSRRLQNPHEVAGKTAVVVP